MLDRGSYDPRRGYDEEGREVTPATVANTQQNGARGITVRCGCNYEALLSFERLNPAWFVPDIALRLRCSACSGKWGPAYPDWTSGWRSVR